MTGGIRVRLFLASIAVIVAIGLPVALLVRAELSDAVERQAEHALRDQARMAEIAMAASPVEARSALAQQLAKASGDEVEVITTGDEGFHQRDGRAYYAVTIDGDSALVQVSSPLDELDAAYDRLYTLLAIAALIAIAVAIGMTWAATKIMTRSLQRLVARARAVAASDDGIRIPIESADEMAALAGSINRMADGLDRSARALARERVLVTSILDGISHGVIALDGERRITLINDAARRIFDLENVAPGAPLIDLVRLPAVIDLLDRLDPREPASAEFQTSAGLRVFARATPLRSGGGAILMLEDVTAVRRLETIRRDFVANVSHELRTPVSIIRANAETLHSGAKDDPRFAGRLIDGVHRNAERLARILADLLDLSRLEAGQYRIEAVPVSIRGAAEQAVASLDGAPAEKQIEVSVSVPEDLTVRADPKALDQVLVNLVDNAVKYTPTSGHVQVEAHRHGERVRIEVKDDGPGIAPRHRERIFERFYRVDPGRSREVGGTGLGLSIVKHLVESMNGQVGVAGNEPRGTVFWIELPQA